jgi:UDP-N-acetyl-D-galactosamine dehydrogenase
VENIRLCIVGLGYVGLPLAVEFAKKYSVIGFDINAKRINELQNGKDFTLEVDDALLKSVVDANGPLTREGKGLKLSDNREDISACNVFIITVPTPINKHNHPDLLPLYKASETVGKVLKKGDIVIYESTVYPGVTEDECVPVLAKTSNLEFNKDFFAGYSPERINPGDKEHTVTKIMKVTSGSTPETAEIIDQLYKSIITAGTYKAASIKVAEAAKVIENTQRDINIAFVNELSKIFNLLKIDTHDVLAAAGTKWNFLKFQPGLVGGHCIGVDPYYLAQKAQEVGYHPELILAGRRMNDSIGKYIATETIKLMLQKSLKIIDSKVLIMGFTFKENCPDIRNTRVIDIYHELKNFDINVDVYDPWANEAEVKHEYGIDILQSDATPDVASYSAIILAVAHTRFNEINVSKSDNRVVFDVKGKLSKDLSDARL